MSDPFAEFTSRGLTPTAPITAFCELGTDCADVWAAITEAGNLNKVHPFCASNDVDRWPGPDGRDQVHYYSGIHYQRDVTDWRDGVGYDLAVGPPSGKLAIARWLIEPTEPGRCRFSIEVTSFVRTDVGPEARAEYEARAITGAIPSYLDSVVRGVAFYSETGTPVVRNQFGPHPIYSPATT